MNTHNIIITAGDNQIYRQQFAALDVPALILHLNTMPAPKQPRARRSDAGKPRQPQPQLTLNETHQ